MSDFTPGEQVLVDRSLLAEFVRDADALHAVIRVGADTRVVNSTSLSRRES